MIRLIIRAIKHMAHLVVLGSVLMGIWTCFQFAYFSLMPMSHWLEYDSIKPSKVTFQGGEEITFVTKYWVHHASGFKATHNLFCNSKESKVFPFYSTQINEFAETTKSSEQKTGSFIFHESVPIPPRTCYLESNIEIILPLGVRHDISFVGDNFEIKEFVLQ